MSTAQPDLVSIRAVKDLRELRVASASIASLSAASVSAEQDFRLDRLVEHFETDRVMLVAVDADGLVCGAGFGYRESVTAVKVQALAVQPQHRRRGLGSRLLDELERRARNVGSTSIYLGAESQHARSTQHWAIRAGATC